MRRTKDETSVLPHHETIQHGSFDVSQVDAVRWLDGLDASSVDLLITDPPYESLEKHRAIGTTTRLKQSKASSNLWFTIFPNSRLPELFQAAFRVLRRNSHLYLFCDPDTMWHAVPAAQQAGFRYWKPIVWDKVALGMGSLPAKIDETLHPAEISVEGGEVSGS